MPKNAAKLQGDDGQVAIKRARRANPARVRSFLKGCMAGVWLGQSLAAHFRAPGQGKEAADRGLAGRASWQKGQLRANLPT